MTKTIKTICSTILYSPIIWALLSYLEIILKNTQLHPEYSKYNLIVILFKSIDELLKGGIF